MAASVPDLFFDPQCHPQGPELLSQLILSLQRSNHLANFACGGTVPIRSYEELTSQPIIYPRPSPPVVIRWDHREDSDSAGPAVGYEDKKAVFPEEVNNSVGVSALVGECQPATFGRGQRDVLDESYRKAGKLDTTQFSTNFCPHETGIIDAVTTVLLNQSVIEKDQVSFGVWAELYKLNVYSGPTGRFKAHVDTPRSDKQFGSLVVCLPYPHSGGALEVRHEGKLAKFDWSADSSQARAIHWAAFYSDCEHEVMEVTSGHRITLTYNLYHKSTMAISPAFPLPINGKQTPFYDTMHSLMQMPEFLNEGGLLGIYCSHSYPHTHPHHYSKIPHMLKGADAAIYRSLAELPGVTTRLLPILPKGVDCDYLYEYEKKLIYEESGISEDRLYLDGEDAVDKLLTGFDGSFDTLHQKLFSSEQSISEPSEDEQRLSPVGKRKDLGYNWNETPRFIRSHINLAGAELQPLREHYGPECMSLSEIEGSFRDAFPLEPLRNVQWLNEAHSKELSMVYLAYGNQASQGYVYSSLSFIVSIPPFRERRRD